MPATCGDYILRTTLLNPTDAVKYPVVSEWDIRVLEAKVPAPVAEAVLHIPAAETELLALAHRLGLRTVPDPAKADLLLLGRASWEGLDDCRRTIEKAVAEAQAS